MLLCISSLFHCLNESVANWIVLTKYFNVCINCDQSIRDNIVQQCFKSIHLNVTCLTCVTNVMYHVAT